MLIFFLLKRSFVRKVYVFAIGSTYQCEGARNSCDDLGAAVLYSVV